MVVKATTGSDVYVAIEQGGTIMAEGTSSNPIVFTSDSATPNPGDWGGLIVLGRAPINSVVGGDATSTSEIGGLPYGGSIADDDSGIIRYVRIEYSGGAADAASENNGFSFYAVGSGTTIDFIQAFELGRDDNKTPGVKLITIIYFITTSLSTVGLGDIYAQTSAERVL